MVSVDHTRPIVGYNRTKTQEPISARFVPPATRGEFFNSLIAASTLIGIIHLSDIHFSVDVNAIEDRYDLLCNSLRDDFIACKMIFLIISGDVANKGLVDEYVKANDLFGKLITNLGDLYERVKIRIVIVPGNHDCDFTLESQVRRNSVLEISYDNIGSDNSVIDICTSVQKNFWNFFSIYNDLPENKIYYKIVDYVDDKKICFHCFNTAWMSQVKEKPGTLFFPVKAIPELQAINECGLNIAVFHHPISWLNPNTKENNRKEYQNVLDSLVSLQIVGHEHQNELRKSENVDMPESNAICATGDILQDIDNSEVSGFQTFVIDLGNNLFKLNRYIWNGNIYNRHSERKLSLARKSTRPIAMQESFMSKLDDLSLPLSFGSKKVLLSDLYVYPHLEDASKKHSKKIEDYIDSSRLLELHEEGACILEGESQIGKSSLLKRLTAELYEREFYPILMSGLKLKNDNIDQIVKEAFRYQYISSGDNYDRYRQLPRNRKILLIDDMHACHLNKEHRRELIEGLEHVFGSIFVTIDATHGIHPQYQSLFKSAKYYSIKPLGYAKRNILVENYVRHSEVDVDHIGDVLIKVRNIFDRLTAILGNKLIPPCPVFILTIIHSLNYTPLNLNETSYGYCYQTIIYLALSNSGVSKDHIDSFINFITELAFEMFKKNTSSISENDFEVFYDHCRTKFWAPNFGDLDEKLIKSKVVKKEYGEYQFGYIYMLYFLAVKKIAEIIDKEDGKIIINNLLENMHVERNANILVFTTHHTKSEKFIQEAILAAMLPFESTPPITLSKNCHYGKLLQDVVKEIKNDVIEMRDPLHERNEQMMAKDRVELEENDRSKDEDIEDNIHFRPFIQAIRSIEIVGQIVRNRKGSLEMHTLKDMISELYNTGFRMIGYMGIVIGKEKEDIARNIKDMARERDSTVDIERKVHRYLEFISLQACLAVFTNLIHNIGIKELHNVFNEVADEINTPAAHLISFSINSYYDTLNIKELEKLSREFKDNLVALQLLRSRVKVYVYNNHVDYRLKQRIGACLAMDVPAKVGRLKLS